MEQENENTYQDKYQSYFKFSRYYGLGFPCSQVKRVGILKKYCCSLPYLYIYMCFYSSYEQINCKLTMVLSNYWVSPDQIAYIIHI